VDVCRRAEITSGEPISNVPEVATNQRSLLCVPWASYDHALGAAGWCLGEHVSRRAHVERPHIGAALPDYLLTRRVRRLAKLRRNCENRQGREHEQNCVHRL